MNIEEGELRPQLLDRFGLNLALDGQPQPAERAEIVRRRPGLRCRPRRFSATLADEQDALAMRCQNASAWPISRWMTPPGRDQPALLRRRRRWSACRSGLAARRPSPCRLAWRGGHQPVDIDAVEDFVLRHRRRQPQPPAATPPEQSQAPQQAQEQNQAEGQWGELPAQPQAMGERRVPPRWPKKP